MNIRSIILGLGTLLSVAGCNDLPTIPGGEALLVTLEQQTYAPGDEVQFQVLNTSIRDIPYSFCPMRLQERESDGRWTDASNQPDPSEIMCALALYVLRSGESVDGIYHLRENLAPGTYRVILMPEIVVDNVSHTRISAVVTPAFDVVAEE